MADAPAGHDHRQPPKAIKALNRINVLNRMPESSRTLLETLDTRVLLTRRMQISDFARL
jgi:hypothetical protein